MNEIQLYHVSLNKYENGTLLRMTANDETHYYGKKKEKGENWVDDILNICKPTEAPMRQQTFYAFDSIENCVAFSKTNNFQNAYYYKVQMQNPFKAPMCLTDLLLKSYSNKIKQVSIASEYWKPKIYWKFNEYLSVEMIIIESIAEPDFFALLKGKENYNNDFDLIRTSFNHI